MNDETKQKLKMLYRDELLTSIEISQRTIDSFEEAKTRTIDAGIISDINQLIEFERQDIQNCRNKLAALRKGGRLWD